MSALTMSFFSIESRRADSSHYIFFLTHWFKMFRIYAGRVFTKMINMKPSFDFLFMKFIRESMGIFISIPNSKVSISTAKCCTPNPAGFSLFDFFPESVFSCFARLFSFISINFSSSHCTCTAFSPISFFNPKTIFRSIFMALRAMCFISIMHKHINKTFLEGLIEIYKNKLGMPCKGPDVTVRPAFSLGGC